MRLGLTSCERWSSHMVLRYDPADRPPSFIWGGELDLVQSCSIRASLGFVQGVVVNLPVATTAMFLAVYFAILGALAIIVWVGVNASRTTHASTGTGAPTLLIGFHLVAAVATAISIIFALRGIPQLGTWAAFMPAVGLLGGMFALVFSGWFACKDRRPIYVLSTIASLPACCWALSVAMLVW